jgi:hypothetical protein
MSCSRRHRQQPLDAASWPATTGDQHGSTDHWQRSGRPRVGRRIVVQDCGTDHCCQP